jgi:hypothetical protein
MKKAYSTWVIGCLAGLFLACSSDPVDPVTVLQNEAIDAETRTQIQSLNLRLLNGFSANDPSAMRELFADDVLASIESGPGLDQVFAQIRGVLADAAVTPFHDFDITLTEPQEEAIEVPAEGDRGFSLTLVPSGTRMHVSLVEAKSGFRDHLLGLVYTGLGPAGDGWRLQALRVGGLRVDGKTALDWHAEARRLNEENLLVPSAMRLVVAGDLLQPVPFMRYDEEAAVVELEQSVSRSLAESHSFPLPLAGVPGPPSVIRMEPVFRQRELLTLVSYVTTQALDRATIENEVLEVHEALTDLFPGLCEGAERVAYRAFAEPPVDRQKNYNSLNALAPCL